MHVLQPAPGSKPGHRGLSHRAAPGVRLLEGEALGRVPEVRALEPVAHRGAVGGGGGVRANIPGAPNEGLYGKRWAGKTPGGPDPGTDWSAPAAGVRGVALRGPVRSSKKEGDPLRRRRSDELCKESCGSWRWRGGMRRRSPRSRTTCSCPRGPTTSSRSIGRARRRSPPRSLSWSPGLPRIEQPPRAGPESGWHTRRRPGSHRGSRLHPPRSPPTSPQRQ